LFRTLFEGPVGIILIAIIIAIFAGPKLPKAAKGIAESIKVFKKEIKTDEKPAENSDSAKKSDD
jgi:sec-independent protein translocase protein TatA